MVVARKMRAESSNAEMIAKQAVSSIRTVYSFSGEEKTCAGYSAALRQTVQLGVRQGLAKGWAVGSTGISFAIWSVLSYYGSRLVMYHGAKGGPIHAISAMVTFGGL